MDLSTNKENNNINPSNKDKQNRMVNSNDKKRAPRHQIMRQIEEKVKAINMYHKGKTKADISRTLNTPESTIRGWIKDEPAIRAKYEATRRSSMSSTNSVNEGTSVSAAVAIRKYIY